MSGVTHTPGVLGGRACIAGTRIPVWAVEVFYRAGAPEAARLAWPRLAEAQLAAAHQYALENPDEIARDLRENDAYSDDSV